MPLYEYVCSDCGKRTERIEKFSGPHLKKCPHCGGRVERQISASAIQFKGSGWYVTDYARSSKAGSDSKPSEASSDGDKSESKPESKPAEKSPAPAKEKKKAREK